MESLAIAAMLQTNRPKSAFLVILFGAKRGHGPLHAGKSAFDQRLPLWPHRDANLDELIEMDRINPPLVAGIYLNSRRNFMREISYMGGNHSRRT